MPTIHVYFEDDTPALACVAQLLNMGCVVTVDVDEIDPATEISTLLSEALTRYAADPAPTVIVPDPQAVYDARYAQAYAARDVVCPACGADVDQPCVRPGGKAYGAFAHVDRLGALQAAVAQQEWIKF